MSDLRDVQRELRSRSRSARSGSTDPEASPQQSAALRGKARGYDEAADLIESLLRGGRIRRKWRALIQQRPQEHT